jgi:membrane-bound lytic murein transglycosylase D
MMRALSPCRAVPGLASLVTAGLVIGVALLGGSARAQADEFTRVPVLEPNVAFWKKVYIEWSINNIALHDEQDLGIVYRVLTVPPRGSKNAQGLTRAEAIKKGQSELEVALHSLAKKNPKSAEGLTGLEKEVFTNLKGVSRADKYTRHSTIRAQNGLRERFLQGWANSGLYWTFIEAEMKRNGLPPELIAVAFVESLFYVGAKSKVGAAGVWQFMSYTGKEYMHLNSVVDERYDPILATEAAAKYLRQAKKELGTWPLAVTSYNYGRAGMRGLANGAGTKDFGVILAVSKNKRFGFAARNYYASFLAVHDILKNKDVLLKGFERKKTWSYDVIRAPFSVYSTQLAATREIDIATLEALNPALTNEARDGKIPLPHGISLRVPKGKGDAIMQKLAALPERERLRGMRAVKAVHKCTGKQSVADIAKKYGVSTDTLTTALGLDAKAVPEQGQQVPIPQETARYTLLPEARNLPALPAPARTKILLADATLTPDSELVKLEKPAETTTDSDKAERLAREQAQKAERAKVALASAEPQGKVTVGRIQVVAISHEIPGVDIIAGFGASTLPLVDVVAGDPGPDAPWPAPAARELGELPPSS